MNRKRTESGAVGASRGGLLASARALGRLSKTLALSAIVAAAFFFGGRAAYRWLTSGDQFRIRTIQWSGLDRSAEDELVRLLPVKTGDNLWLADTDAMAHALRRAPWVKSVSVERDPPRALHVRILERRATALIELGGLYLVDADAEVFKRAATGDGLDLPIITGLTRDDYVQRRRETETRIAAALALLQSYAKEGLADLAVISEVHVDFDQGVTLYVGDEGTEVRLGNGELPVKLARLRKTIEMLRAEGRVAEVLHLDNRVRPSWVTVRLAGTQETKGRTGPRGP